MVALFGSRDGQNLNVLLSTRSAELRTYVRRSCSEREGVLSACVAAGERCSPGRKGRSRRCVQVVSLRSLS